MARRPVTASSRIRTPILGRTRRQEWQTISEMWEDVMKELGEEEAQALLDRVADNRPPEPNPLEH